MLFGRSGAHYVGLGGLFFLWCSDHDTADGVAPPMEGETVVQESAAEFSMLIVSDSPIERRLLAAGLRARGLRVEVSSSSTAELASWLEPRRERAIDGALVDLASRNAAGIEVALGLRSGRDDDWPWIAVAPRADAVQRAAVRHGGAAGLLVGVEDLDVVAAAVLDVVTRARATGAARVGRKAGTRGPEVDHAIRWAHQMFGLDDDELACVRGIFCEHTNARIARSIGKGIGPVSRAISRLQEKLDVTTRGGVAARILAGSRRSPPRIAAAPATDGAADTEVRSDEQPQQ